MREFTRRVGDHVPWIIALVILGAFAAAAPQLAGIVLAVSLTGLAWRWPNTALGLGALCVLVARPTLDMFGERRLGLGPFAMSPAVIFGLAVLWMAGVIAVRRGRERRSLWPDKAVFKAHLPLLLAYAIGLTSGLLHYRSLALGVGMREMVRMASVLGGFLLVSWWASEGPERYRRGWGYIVLGAVPPVALAVWQLVTGTGNLETEGINRLQGTFSHPHSLGPYLVPFILCSVAAGTAARAAPRFGWLILASGLSILLALTFSRTAELVLITSLIALPLFQARTLGRRAFSRGVLAVSLFGIIGWAIAGNYVRERFSGLRIGAEAIEAARTGRTENSLEWRLVNWGGLIALGLDNPVTGHGLGMTTVLNPLTDFRTGLPYTAHDDFVRIFFEVGTVGLLCYLLYGALLVRWALTKARRAQAPLSSSAIAIPAALVALFFLTVGTPEWGTQTAEQFELYGMLALLTALDARWGSGDAIRANGSEAGVGRQDP